MGKRSTKKHFLREWRKSKPGRTLEDVAADLNISQPQLGRIERGDQPYNQKLLEALAAMYECTVVDLLIRDPSDKASIWTIWERATPDQRRMIEASARGILEAGEFRRTGTNG